MAATPPSPKQWCLTKTETVTSFEIWRQNLVYTLPLDAQFAPFLLDGPTWLKKTKNSPLRGFTDGSSSVPEASRRTAQQKVRMLELMLDQIANYCPVISRNTGAHFLDFSEIHLQHGERPEVFTKDLWLL